MTLVRVSRRRVNAALAALGTFTLGPDSLGPDSLGSGLAGEARGEAACLQACLSDPDGARALGERYLAAFPDEAAALAPLAAEVRRVGADGPAVLRRAVGRRIRADFAAGETVVLDGWVMARTEGRIAALAACGSA